MVGFRVFDVGLLLVWLVWFFRLRDDEDDRPDEGGGGGGEGPKPRPDSGGPGGGGLKLPLGRFRQGRSRLRDHRPPRLRPGRRGSEPLPTPAPSRVRSPRAPLPAHRRG
jgi:hypothetical protein